MSVVWLASYPRSGNTFLRTILWHCFGLQSASVYPNDLGGNRKLENYVGHIEHAPGIGILFPEDAMPLVKTHEHPIDDNPAIYVVRDGRAASVSMWKFYNGALSLRAVIEGQHRFGTWSSHLRAWKPWERPNTLLLEYEHMRTNLPLALEEISAFLRLDILGRSIPDRNIIARKDGQWVKRKSDWKADMPSELLARFNEINQEMLEKIGYLP
jgi:hypothetical protein